MKNLWIYDTEGDGLCGNDIAPEDHMTKFHTLLFKMYGKDNWVLFLDHDHPEFQEAKVFAESKGVNLTIKDFKGGECFKEWIRQPEVAALACQNQSGYDLKAFKFVWGIDSDYFPESVDGVPMRLYDTLSMSRTLHPDRKLPRGCPSKVKNPLGGKARTIGPHSLEAWGCKLKNTKVEISDWRGLPLWKYVDRVWQDVIINELQWQALIVEMKSVPDLGIDWKIPLRRNMQTDYLMEVQQEQGVCFNKKGAEKLLVICDDMQLELAEFVEPSLPLRLLPKSDRSDFPAKPFTGEGEISSNGWKWLSKRLGYEVNQEALDFQHPPKTAFKGDGSVSKAGERYCEKFDVTDSELMPDFIRSCLKKGNELEPLSSEDLIKAKQDLIDKKSPDWLVPMKIGDGDSIKTWLIDEGGWIPTLFNTKNATIDDQKQTLPDDEITANLIEYIEKTRQSSYKKHVYSEMGIDMDKVLDQRKILGHLRKKARFLVTSPKLKDQNGLCPNLEKVEGELAKAVVKWLSLRNRRAVIKTKDLTKDTGWLNNKRLLKGDGKLSARSTGITPTNRRKHTVIANVPSAGALLGHEMRGLFGVPEGFWQLGIDGSNLEGMMAAWQAYDFDGGEYLSRMQSGDNHSVMAAAYSKAAGKEISRNGGKPITYGVMYGAQANKVAEMLGVGRDKGQDVIDAYWDTNYGLKGRKEWLEAYWKETRKKYIQGIDGRKIFTRSKHSLLNARLQSAGAIGMDLAGILFHEKAKKEGLLGKGLARTIYYHDEYQLQVPDEMMRWKKFETGVEDRILVDKVWHQIKNEKKNKKNGKDFLSFCQIGLMYGLAEDDIISIDSAKNSADSYSGGKFLLSGNTYTFDNGAIGRNYSRAGCIMVEAIEEAYEELNCPVTVTGEYLCGKTWGDCH